MSPELSLSQISGTLTENGIEQAVSGLNYTSPGSLKYKYLNAIRRRYDSPDAISTLTRIDQDILIREIWTTIDDPDAVRAKRKNLSSIRSTVNADLNRLYESGGNPEGITISPDHVFVMSEEAKNERLSAFSQTMRADGAMDLDKVSEVLSLINEFIASYEGKTQDADTDQTLDNIKKILNSLRNMALDEEPPPEADEVDDTELDIIDDDDILEEIDDDVEIIDADEADLIDDEPLDIVDDEEFEDIDDEVEILDEDEIDETDGAETGPGGGEDLEPVDEAEVEILDDDEIDIVDDEEFEDIDDEAEILDEDEIDETDDAETGPAGGEDLEPVDEAEVEAVDEDEIDIVDDEEFEDIDDEVEILDEDDLDIVEDEEFEDVDDEAEILDEDEIDETDDAETGAAGSEDLEPVDETEVEAVDEDDLEIVDDEEFEDIDDEVEILDEDDLDIVEDEEFEDVDDEAEILDEGEIDEADDAETGAAGSEDLEPVDETEVETVDEDDLEIVDDEEFEDIDDEVEILDEDEVRPIEGGAPAGGLPDDGPDRSVTPEEETRRLAEQFDRQLSAMDRYYNSYLNIPKGTYRVGSPAPVKHELPEREVWVDEFFMGKFPITNALFEVFVSKTGYRTTAEKIGHGLVYTGRFRKTVDKKTGQIRSTWSSSHRYDVVKGACWYHPEGPDSSLINRLHHPVVQVSREDALAFAAWVGKSLPTEVEWEAAARTVKGYAYPWGNQWVLHACNMEDSAVSGTTAVDHYLDFMNDYHLADLLGNVLEWTCDSIPSPYNAKKNMRYLVAKGGSFISGGPVPLWARFVFKDDYTSNIVGFRCAVR
ncbi:hypothetical protein JCM14469_26400 [Desulfatiferula olefinivorans]